MITVNEVLSQDPVTLEGYTTTLAPKLFPKSLSTPFTVSFQDVSPPPAYETVKPVAVKLEVAATGFLGNNVHTTEVDAPFPEVFQAQILYSLTDPAVATGVTYSLVVTPVKAHAPPDL